MPDVELRQLVYGSHRLVYRIGNGVVDILLCTPRSPGSKRPRAMIPADSCDSSFAD